jgi:hypothetical protein
MQLGVNLEQLDISNAKELINIWTGDTEKIVGKQISYEVEPHATKYMIIK